jgi:uncharacterized protein (TIGR02246 family)
MKYSMLIILVSMLFSAFAFAQDSDARAKIEAYNERWEKAMLNNDMNAVLELYADDVISLPSYASIMRGKNEVRAHMDKEMQSGMKFTDVNFETIEVRQEGDLAIEIGTYDMSMTMGGSAEPWSDKGKYVTVWEKQGNEWKVIIETWNTDTNPWEQMKEKEGQKEEMQE